MKDSTAVKAQVVRELVQATSEVRALAVGAHGGFSASLQVGNTEKILVNSRGNIRIFAKLDTLGSFFRRIGILRFEVDLRGYQPGRLRAPRPDRAAALRETRTRPHQQPLEFRNA